MWEDNQRNLNKNGMWINISRDFICCSECNNAIFKTPTENEYIRNLIPFRCPSCGCLNVVVPK